MAEIRYDYIIELMLEVIERQRSGDDDNFVLGKFSEKKLKKVEVFLRSFIPIEQGRIEEFANSVEAVTDEYWKQKINQSLKID